METPVKENQYAFFNKFQTMFYTNIHEFNQYTFFEIKNNAFRLLDNITKGFPYLSNEIMDIYSPHVKAIQSPAIIIALQRKFVNNFSRARIPQYIYYKSQKVKESKKKEKVTNLGIIFPPEIVTEISSMLMYDSKTYEYLKFSEKTQSLGKQLLGELQKKEEQKILKTKTRKN